MTKGILMQMHKDNKGFTLIELMIVVAIIGILAAIAIPQFASYRIRGFNASTQSDVKNMATSQAGFFADWQAYGETHTDVTGPALAAPSAGDAGVLLTGPGDDTTLIAAFVQGDARLQQLGLGNAVSIIANTGAGGPDFTVIAKHLQGDSYWATDDAVTAIYFEQVDGSSGTALVAADAIASTAANDITAAVDGPGGTAWLVK